MDTTDPRAHARTSPGPPALPSPAGLGFTVLGQVRAYRDGVEIPEIGPPQQQATLVTLLLRVGHAVSMAQLIDAVWGEQAPRAAARAIRTYVWRLRRLLGSGGAPAAEIASVGDGYRLDIPRGSIDAALAESLVEAAAERRARSRAAEACAALDEAVALWRGEPLAGVPGPFAERQRDRLAELRISLIEERSELDLVSGRFQTAIPHLRELAAAFPLRERLQGLLMRALYGAGRQADALAVYTASRARLIEEIGIEPGPELAGLHRQILKGGLPHSGYPADREGGLRYEPEAASARRSPPTPAPAPADPARPPVPDPRDEPPPATDPPASRALPVPAQLPPDIPDFTGRDAEVRELCAVLTEPERAAPAAVAITGMGGIGKSCLAVHVAHRVRQSYPDGQLYARFESADAGVDATGSVLSAFLSMLGVDADQVPHDVAGRSRLLRSLLDGRSTLIVLDNVQDTDTARIHDLIPGSATCAVIITSRARIVGLPLTRQRCLEVFRPEEALTLLARDIGVARLDGEREQALAVVTACGRLPLAIRIVGARLAARPGWTLATMAERLTDERRSMAELRAGGLAIEAVFELGYRQLDPVQARALRLLGAAGAAEFTLPAATAVLDLAEDGAEELLESLVDTAMLTPSVQGRYRFHPLVHVFARQRAVEHDGAEVHEALDRILGFLLATACNAVARVTPDAPVRGALEPGRRPGLPLADARAARAWAAAETDMVVLATLRVLALPARTAAESVAVVVDLLLAVSLLDAAHRALTTPVLRSLGALARASGDQRAIGRVEYLWSGLALREAAPADAVRHARAAVEAASACGDTVIARQATSTVDLLARPPRRHGPASRRGELLAGLPGGPR